MFEHAAKLNWEGIISKGRSLSVWAERKLAENQNRPEGQIPVIGFIKDPSGIAALYLGKREGKDLVYMSKVARVVPGKPKKRPQRLGQAGA